MAEGLNVPFPPSGEFVQSIRDSCKALREKSNIKVERSSIERLLLSSSFIESFQRVSKAHGLAFPLNFPSTVSELNLLSVLSLLNFGSGYRIPLHEQTKRGAWDNIRALVFSFYITSTTDTNWLSAKGMKEIGAGTVAEQMRVSVHVERKHETLHGVTVGEVGGPMHQLVQLITKTLNETGAVLVDQGYPDLGSFVLQALKSSQKNGQSAPVDVDAVLEKIVRAIPGFRDMEVVNGQPVYVFKKALFLLHAIKLRFENNATEPSVPIPDTSTLPIFSDNVVPSMLVYLGVLDLSSSDPSLGLDSAFPDHSHELPLFLKSSPEAQHEAANILLKEPPTSGPVLNRNQSYAMRAAAIDACEMIVEVARSGIDAQGAPEWLKEVTLPDIDLWLWAVAKDRPDYRQLERFEFRETAMF